MRHSFYCARLLPLVLEKKSFYNFLLSSLRHGHFKKTKFHFSTTFTTPWSWKKLFTLSFIKNTFIATTSTSVIMTKKHIFSFQHYNIHYTGMITFSPIANCYYVHSVVIMSKKIVPIVTTFTTPWSWQKYKFLFQHYLYYTLIITKNILFSFHYYAL